jgi:ATP-dependent Clp protease ATP-binding subunit ClpC
VIEQIRLHPFLMILLDEIENARAEVFDALLNVFDEARMIDAWGRDTNFCTAVFIMTSNRSGQNRDSIGFSDSTTEPHLDEVKKFFRPEFFNRLDGILSFRHFALEDVKRITEIEIQNLARQGGLEKRNLQLHCSDELTGWLSEKGYDRRLGARPLQWVIEAQVTRHLAHFLAAHPTACNQHLHFTLDHDQVVWEDP